MKSKEFNGVIPSRESNYREELTFVAPNSFVPRDEPPYESAEKRKRAEPKARSA
jgi:hypothetical protein